MQLQQFLKAQRLSQKPLVQRGPPPLNKMQYFANDSRTEYQKQQQSMHQKMMQQRVISCHTNNNSIPEDSPNPMDFLEVSSYIKKKKKKNEFKIVILTIHFRLVFTLVILSSIVFQGRNQDPILNW